MGFRASAVHLFHQEELSFGPSWKVSPLGTEGTFSLPSFFILYRPGNITSESGAFSIRRSSISTRHSSATERSLLYRWSWGTWFWLGPPEAAKTSNASAYFERALNHFTRSGLLNNLFRSLAPAFIARSGTRHPDRASTTRILFSASTFNNRHLTFFSDGRFMIDLFFLSRACGKLIQLL